MLNDTENTPRGNRKGRMLRRGVVTIAVLGAVGAAGVVAAQGMGFRPGFGGPFGGAAIERMADAADATDAQMDEIRAIVEAAREDIRPLIEMTQGRRAEFMELLGAEPLDRAAFEALRQDMLASVDEVSARALQGFLDAAEVLTPEQRAAVIADRARAMNHRYGHGGRHGHRDDRGERGSQRRN